MFGVFFIGDLTNNNNYNNYNNYNYYNYSLSINHGRLITHTDTLVSLCVWLGQYSDSVMICTSIILVIYFNTLYVQQNSAVKYI